MKAMRIVKIVFTVLAVGMAALSGIMKLSGSAEVIATLSKVGVEKYVVILGLMEIVFAALFVFPRTLRIGFILLSCYFAGALATELSHGMPLNALLPIILVWIAAFLRDKDIFIGSSGKTI